MRAQSPADASETARDTLVYNDGDRLHGKFIGMDGNYIVFQSDRFGKLLVPKVEAVVIKAEKPPVAPSKTPGITARGVKPAPANAAVKEKENEETQLSMWQQFSLAKLTSRVRDFFGPWHGKIAFSDELVNDTAHRDNLALETLLKRKFSSDVVELTGHYDFDRTNRATTTDLLRGTGSWRHDFGKRQFVQYRPQVEWNRASVLNGAPNKYVLLEQEFGYGFNLWAKPTKSLRLGVSENLFDNWNSGAQPAHSSRSAASIFDEAEFALPWQLALTQRATWFPGAPQHGSWQDQVELNKKLTQTLSVALRHEIRRRSPDGAAQDYTRLRLLLGLDF